jgi:lipid-A-disaccharide synthase
MHVFLIAGEASGDALGAALMRALRARVGEGAIRFSGIGGPAMTAAGLAPIFPMADIAVMGVSAVVARLPLLLARMRTAAKTAVALAPDMLVTIDSPDFNLRVARRVRRASPRIPIVHMVCPSVWAWRSGRARRMRPHVDRILALLPFEPAAMAGLGGPPTTYVGHPLIERIGELRPSAVEQRMRDGPEPEILVLPGSRRTEIGRMLPLFRDAVERVARRFPQCRFTLPAVAHLQSEIAAHVAAWPRPVSVVVGEEQKWAAFRRARAALAASGTVTLELALSGVPMVAAYRLSWLEAQIGRCVLKIRSVLLPNLILDENVVPEFLQEYGPPEVLAEALVGMIEATPARQTQLDAFARLDTIMGVGGPSPSDRAAGAILEMVASHGQVARSPLLPSSGQGGREAAG